MQNPPQILSPRVQHRTYLSNHSNSCLYFYVSSWKSLSVLFLRIMYSNNMFKQPLKPGFHIISSISSVSQVSPIACNEINAIHAIRCDRMFPYDLTDRKVSPGYYFCAPNLKIESKWRQEIKGDCSHIIFCFLAFCAIEELVESCQKESIDSGCAKYTRNEKNWAFFTLWYGNIFSSLEPPSVSCSSRSIFLFNFVGWNSKFLSYLLKAVYPDKFVFIVSWIFIVYAVVFLYLLHERTNVVSVVGRSHFESVRDRNDYWSRKNELRDTFRLHPSRFRSLLNVSI